MDTLEIIEHLPKSKIRKIVKDPVKTAEAINLVYVTDDAPALSEKEQAKILLTM